jgi:hypothetical protein
MYIETGALADRTPLDPGSPNVYYGRLEESYEEKLSFVARGSDFKVSLASS